MSFANVKVLLGVLWFVQCTFVSGQEIERATTYDFSTSYLKVSLYPLVPTALFKKDAVWIVLDFENRIRTWKGFSYNLVLDYHNYTFTSSVNGVQISKIPNNIDIIFRPQIRYYLSKLVYQGYFIGAFPLYLYRDLPSIPIKGNYLGLGLITGYQIFVKKKFPLEFNIVISHQRSGSASTLNSQGQPVTMKDSYMSAYLELNFGVPIRKQQ